MMQNREKKSNRQKNKFVHDVQSDIPTKRNRIETDIEPSALHKNRAEYYIEDTFLSNHLLEHDYCNSSQNHDRSATQFINNYHFNEHSYANLSLPLLTNEINEHYLGAMDILCIHCNAKHFVAEKVSNKGNSFNDCCSHGNVKLDPLPDPPEMLKKLFDGTHVWSSHFFNQIRCINSSFSFASFNANLVEFNNRRPGPYCFKIHGQIYYQFNTALYPEIDELPKYGQLFILDANEATNHRLNMNSDLNAQVIQVVENVMREHNIFVHSYQMMKEELDALTEVNGGKEPELELLFTLKKGHDKRRFNFQRVNEVAAIFSTTADGEIPESYVTVRNKNTKNLQYVSSMDANVEPWTYPLFYPYGNRGWYDGIKMVGSNRRVTRNAYVKYLIAIRDYSNYILMGRRLFQQCIVDFFVKSEKDRMNFLKNNQKQLRADSYEGLLQHLENRSENTNSRIGKVVILPSTYPGSPRYMQQNYQDAMTIVRKFGKPDLFISMTCNPKWREITENLLSGQTASDRPDLVARVFELKKEELINIIVKQKLFGEVQAYVYVVENQKRGLPHVHLLITLKPNFKITTPEVVDKFISAEIPDPTENLRLHKIVETNMIHGPCGAWCLDNEGKCSKNYPHMFNNETNMDEDGYPHYRRRNTGTYTRRDGFEYDNRSVVPHNKSLLLALNCHINVEVVTSIKAVKYLYKYIFKGHDAASVVIQDTPSNDERSVIDHDEIKSYIETRYVSPPEACGRILSNNLQGKSHSIYRLPVHLPNQQTVIVENIDDSNSIRSALNRSTELPEYFSINERDPEARKYIYSEMPFHYVFKKEKNCSFWQKRKKQFNTLGRMYSVSPSQTELFHLRLLLNTVKGATSFQDLRTVNGIIHETFVSACLALGLIEDDNEWKNAMHEAEVWMMPRQLRHLFVRILIHCQPIHPEELWEEFKEALSHDYLRTMPESFAQRNAYIHINTLLAAENSSITNFSTMP
ncbi:uncharacterized protein LOC122502175 [Leptopilina heterotoma]|uniref:uncharacterized protein LOC122502175 n=1 Tax=Leptopilina heterotoma TaxID=63436 RepID=UPI001CA9DF56|nr:uncharacterized protein LOC122502175 [Leptopilina heterotoma]